MCCIMLIIRVSGESSVCVMPYYITVNIVTIMQVDVCIIMGVPFIICIDEFLYVNIVRYC